ncbi:hypothetical protein LTR53_000242 [Teratosphaeriaceae sp. CCFEE 6253]|nr:hypothetical protein LTR53_000242 [Teratosphaeriaceae sp. CCFEE 6253]
MIYRRSLENLPRSDNPQCSNWLTSLPASCPIFAYYLREFRLTFAQAAQEDTITGAPALRQRQRTKAKTTRSQELVMATAGKPDGPHAATRHLKDRRVTISAPAAIKDRRRTYSTEAATAIASLERRLHNLEQQQPSPSTQFLPARCEAATHVDAALKDVGVMYNVHEDRLTEVERTADQWQELQATVARVEQRLRPYDDYQQQALDAVKQLRTLQQKLQSQTPSPDKSSAALRALSTSLRAQEASMRDYTTRLRSLEDQAEQAKAGSMATHDLARALIERTKRGDRLDQDTARELILALGPSLAESMGSAPRAARQQGTPEVTDEVQSAFPERSVDQQHLPSPSTRRPAKAGRAPVESLSEEEANEQPSKKRRRITQSPHQPSLPSRPATVSTDITTSSSPPTALESFKSGQLSDTRAARKRSRPETSQHDEEDGDVAILPERRRTSRAANPTKLPPGFRLWKDAYRTIKNIRPSGPGPSAGKTMA